MITLDASVLIAHLDGTDAHHERATRLLIDAVNEPLLISPITLAECYVGAERHGVLDQARSAVAQLEVTVVPLGDGASERLASLRVQTGLRMPDCCVLLAAETSMSILATFDQRLERAATSIGVGART
ncbi:MAG TPA: PIN domain-containing protein [Microlunatus sp.]